MANLFKEGLQVTELATTQKSAPNPDTDSGIFTRARTVLRSKVGNMGVFGALVLVMLVSALVSPQFLTMPNLLNVIQQIAIVGILALGMTFVIITSGIDLSVGATLALASVLSASMVNQFGIFAGILITVAVGALVGFINGSGVVLGGIPPFVMTLAVMAIVTGVAFIYSGGMPVAVKSSAFIQLGVGRLFGIPIPAICYVVLAIICSFILRRTVFGRSVYAVGSNVEAARLSGVSVGQTTILVYVIGSIMASIGGMLYTAQLASGSATAGGTISLDVIAAVVIGGTSLFGGIGIISGTFIGSAILGVLSNILNLAGVHTYVQEIAKGLIIIGAILIQLQLSKKAK